MSNTDRIRHASNDKLARKGQGIARSKTSVGQFDGEACFLVRIFINSPIGIYVVQDGKFRFVNPEFQKITGTKKMNC